MAKPLDPTSRVVSRAAAHSAVRAMVGVTSADEVWHDAFFPLDLFVMKRSRPAAILTEEASFRTNVLTTLLPYG